ncbi:MAG: zf-HC2 domain-containing protein [Terriglobales bacterium]
MDHKVVTAQNMTERYLLNELDPAQRDEFEEHYFNCTSCAADVQAAALLVEKIKDGAIPDPEFRPEPAPPPFAARPAWLAWLRPAFVIPVMAMLLAVVGYQNLVTVPQMARQLNSPRILPYAQVNLDTYAAEGPTITPQPGQAFLLMVRIPRDGLYSKYTADLYNPAGKLEWSFTFAIPASSEQEQWPLQVPGANREAGRYKLIVRGITAARESKDVGSTSFELQIQK